MLRVTRGAYYNEIDPYAAQWLRNLIAAGHIAPGDVDERSIVEVQADDLKGYVQCHFFAGIGGWPLALQLAGWPADRPIWTGSCPCQPFSAAGKGKAQADARHLWPAWFRLIRECRPERVFGEQVAGAIGWGWLDGVCTDLEAEGYAVGQAVLGAHSVGAPHIRQRLYWVAQPTHSRLQGGGQPRVGSRGIEEGLWPEPAGGGATGGLEGSGGTGLEGWAQQPAREEQPPAERGGDAGGVADAESRRKQFGQEAFGETKPSGTGTASPWSDAIPILCADGRTRRIPAQPALFPLAPRVSGDVVRLRGAGNAIVPQAAAQFVAADMAGVRP